MCIYECIFMYEYEHILQMNNAIYDHWRLVIILDTAG